MTCGVCVKTKRIKRRGEGGAEVGARPPQSPLQPLPSLVRAFPFVLYYSGHPAALQYFFQGKRADSGRYFAQLNATHTHSQPPRTLSSAAWARGDTHAAPKCGTKKAHPPPPPSSLRYQVKATQRRRHARSHHSENSRPLFRYSLPQRKKNRMGKCGRKKHPLSPLHPFTPAAAYLAWASRAPSRSYASNALTASAHSGAAGCLTQ